MADCRKRGRRNFPDCFFHLGTRAVVVSRLGTPRFLMNGGDREYQLPALEQPSRRPEGYLAPEKHTKLRKFFIAVCFVVLYVLLDRSTVAFQILRQISAWYPPTGLALAVLIGIGPSYAPVLLIAGLIASIVNYHLPIPSYSLLAGNIQYVVVYTAAAEILRRVVKIDAHLRAMRDVIWLLLVATCSSILVAFVGTRFLVIDHLIPAEQYFPATLSWGGD